MRFRSPLLPGSFIRRHRRFLADVELEDGRVVTVHCPSSGSMRTCAGEGWPVRLRQSSNAARKYPLTLEMLHNGSCWICIDTQLANRLATEAIRDGTIAELSEYRHIRSEVRTGPSSRIDLRLDGPRPTDSSAHAGGTLADSRGAHDAGRNPTGSADATPSCFVEIKTVTMLDAEGRHAFPDAVTARGRKHLAELSALVASGHRAVLLFLALREDGRELTLAAEIDPAFHAATIEALGRGVELIAYQADVSPEAVRIARRIPIADLHSQDMSQG